MKIRKFSSTSLRKTMAALLAVSLIVAALFMFSLLPVSAQIEPPPDTIKWYQKPNAYDYAQSGIPDFDQKQDNWNCTGTVRYSLWASAASGWGTSQWIQTSPGPTLFAAQGDTVTLTLASADGLPHDFFVDYDGNAAPSPGEPQSPTFIAPIVWSFVVNAPGPLVGPTKFAYACSQPGHVPPEVGAIIINPQRWSWCGPTAVANSLWWWDSHIDGGTNPPPDIEDHFPLVQNYTPGIDDHAPQNVMPFIEHLAGLMNTDVGQCGTNVFDMEEGIRLYLEEKGLNMSFYERTWWDCNLTFEKIYDELYKCEDVVLLLGFYQEIDPETYPEGYQRVGGHYVTVAGMGINSTGQDPPEQWIKFSDPCIDWAEMNNWNYSPYVPVNHTYPHDSSVHNNASLVSHDPYLTYPTPIFLYDINPDIGHFCIEGYPFEELLFEGGLAPQGEVESGPIVWMGIPTYTVVEYAVIFSPLQYDKLNYTDYAPSKMPDFDQRQDNWFKYMDPSGLPLWSYCGPVAVANSLWWMDSKFEPGNIPPPIISDGFPLVQSYGPWDDHNPKNVGPFIQHLATLMKTDVGKNGTNVLEMEAGIRAYLEEKGLNETLYERTWGFGCFTFADIEYEVEQCEDVILLLGRYELQEPFSEWVRINGHYVTVSGVNANGTIKFSDPTLDWAEATGKGEVLPPSGPGHPPGHGPMLHNDTLYVSHDYYNVIQGSPIAGIHWGIEDYPWEYIENFMPQGDVEPEQGITQLYFTAVEYAVIISPLKTPEHDVAVTNVVPSPTTVDQGDDVNVTITAANEGDYIETFTVTAYYDSNIIGTKIVGPLNPKASTTFNITWSTTGVPPGTYTISANASIVLGEIDTADNSFTDGTVTVQAVGVHDVAVIQVIRCIPKELLYPGNATMLDVHANTWTVCINVTVKNMGTFTESFNVKAYYDGTVIGTKAVASLAPGASIRVDFKWTPSMALVHFDSVAKKYTSIYTIKAEAVLAGDANPGDNVKVDGKVRVAITADVNIDGTISGGDLVGIGGHWGETPGYPGYYAMADVNFDGIISGGDLTGVGLYWGNTAPP